ncbi:putative transcription factor bHLH family [Helianthus debilis subsp. tardiflorus]
MEKGFSSWSRDQQSDWQSLNPNISSARFGFGPQVMFPSFGNMGSLPVRQEPCGWFYGLPRYRQGLVPVVNSTVKEKSPVPSPHVARETNEVASSGGPTKKRKREDKGNIENVLEDTASSGKSGINCSSNGAFNDESDGFSSDGNNKRIRKEKIKETINLLQNLIPGDKNGKNAIMVIDEAIHYLRTLKVKAKALGLDSL